MECEQKTSYSLAAYSPPIYGGVGFGMPIAEEDSSQALGKEANGQI